MISFRTQNGFTLIELLVSVAIFVFMTAFLVAKYGTFNQSTLLTNLAYDVALTIRNAQTYGLNVKSRPTANSTYTADPSGYLYGYGVHFSLATTGTPPENTVMIFFSDVNSNLIYDSGEEISTYAMKGGSTISTFCVGPDENNCVNGSRTSLDIIFKRPDPDAAIASAGTKFPYTQITISGSGGSTKKIAVRSTGQISVLHY